MTRWGRSYVLSLGGPYVMSLDRPQPAATPGSEGVTNRRLRTLQGSQCQSLIHWAFLAPDADWETALGNSNVV